MPFDLIRGQLRDLGGFSVRRVLPSLAHRAVGPFVFFDHLGPATLTDGVGIAVRPHPHIGLATVTFLFDGEMIHRDSLGTVQAIRPGDVNWMTAGRGIVHSERSPDAIRESSLPIHGIQSWVAVPIAHEADDPSFVHHPAATLPTLELRGARITVVAGDAYGLRSPVTVLVPTLYAAISLDADATLPIEADHAERAVFVVAGDVALDGADVPAGSMAVLTSTAPATLTTRTPARVMLLGGATLDAPRALDWNFVASDRRMIDAARADWQSYPNARFPQVPGETDHIPLPPRPRPEPTAL
jgi:redox-sensitive bicupin YhaK (pirin superfamily)